MTAHLRRHSFPTAHLAIFPRQGHLPPGHVPFPSLFLFSIFTFSFSFSQEEYKMNSAAERAAQQQHTEEASKKPPNKADLMRMVNQFLLQNGLPVTAAALQKECEKLLAPDGGNGGKLSPRRNRRQQVPPSTAGTEKYLAQWMNRQQQGERGEERQTPMPSPVEEMNSPLPPHPPPPTDRRFGAKSPRKGPQPPPQSGRKSDAIGDGIRQHPNTKKAWASVGHPSGGHSHSTSAPSQSARAPLLSHHSSRANSNQRVGGGGGGMEEEAKEEKKTAKPLRKADSIGNMNAGTAAAAPPDPGPTANPNEGGGDGGQMDEENWDWAAMDESRWLCAHLDMALLGQTLMKGSPGRETALLLQAIRHQLTKAGTLADGEANLRIFAAKDIFQLRNNRKQSLASHLLSDPSSLPEFKEQLSRLLNAIASFRHGRDYLLVASSQGRQLIYETAMALKGRRVVGHAVEHLLAALQKLSIRTGAQKELLMNGMLEWLCLQLIQPKLPAAQLEFGTALLHNLAINPLAHSTLLRHKDQLLATIYWLIGATKNAQVLNNVCATLYTLLGHVRIRQAARERGDLEKAIGDRIQREQQQGGGGSSMAEQQQRQLLALSQILRGELDVSARRKPPASTDDTRDFFPDYLEAEIDSTDPLVPALSELFGQSLLAQKFLPPGAVPPTRIPHQLVQFAIEEDQESVPGVVPVPRRSRPANQRQQQKAGSPSVSRQFHSPIQKPRPGRQNQVGLGGGGGRAQSTGPKESGTVQTRGGGGGGIPAILRQVHFERTNSMSSHATFVVENNYRRPLLAANEFANVIASLSMGISPNNGQKLAGNQQEQRQQQQQRKRAGEAEKLESSSSETLIIEESTETKAIDGNGQKKITAIRATKTTSAAANGKHLRKPSMVEVVKLSQRQNDNSRMAGGNSNRKPTTTTEMAKMFSSKLRTKREKKWPRRESSFSSLLRGGRETPLLLMKNGGGDGERSDDGGEETLIRSATFGDGIDRESEEEEEYTTIFAARPKLCRTPPAEEFQDDLSE